VRWKLDGELREARTSSLPPLPPGTSSLPSGPDFPDTLLDTIQRVDDTTVKLPKKTVDEILGNPMAAAKGARVVPSVKDGKPNGFKLYAIRPSSVYARLGFQNGDTIQSVNGFELTSADKALELYTKLKDATSIELEISRRGVPMTLKIKID
jgi:general secretion pathway protein C